MFDLWHLPQVTLLIPQWGQLHHRLLADCVPSELMHHLFVFLDHKSYSTIYWKWFYPPHPFLLQTLWGKGVWLLNAPSPRDDNSSASWIMRRTKGVEENVKVSNGEFGETVCITPPCFCQQLRVPTVLKINVRVNKLLERLKSHWKQFYPQL